MGPNSLNLEDGCEHWGKGRVWRRREKESLNVERWAGKRGSSLSLGSEEGVGKEVGKIGLLGEGMKGDLSCAWFTWRGRFSCYISNPCTPCLALPCKSRKCLLWA